jgi:hypothetical protein
MNHRAHDSPISEDIRSASCAITLGVKDTGGKMFIQNVFFHILFRHYWVLSRSLHRANYIYLHSIDNVQI